MSPKSDDPTIILGVTPRGIIPATAADWEAIDAMRFGTELEVRKAKEPRSKALAGWWLLMNVVYPHVDRWASPRALSNALLIDFECVETELLLRDGVRKTPLSLRSFTEEQLLILTEKAKWAIVNHILPGVDVDRMIDEHQKERLRRREG